MRSDQSSYLSKLASLCSLFSQALSKALLELRAEMTSAAEQQVIASAAQKEESLNVQMLVDRHTKDLKVGPLNLKNTCYSCMLYFITDIYE